MQWEKGNAVSAENDLNRELNKGLTKNMAAYQAQTAQTQASQEQNSQVMGDQSTASSERDKIAEPSAEKTAEDENKKTFTSSKFNVSFDYTDNLKITEGDNVIVIARNDVSWKIKFYTNSKKNTLETWYKGHFDEKTNANCSFEGATIKVGSYDSTLVKAGSGDGKCENGGNFAVSTDKSKVVKVDVGDETQENINNVLASFKFL